MLATAPIIETGIDKLVKLVKEKAKISMEDAAKELGVSLTVVEEWADFLEEEGIISIEYKFTKAFLVGRKLTKKDIQKKAKEFTGKKEVFIRKAEGILHFLEKEAAKLTNMKEDSTGVKRDFGAEIKDVKKKMEKLEKRHHLKINLDKRIHQQKTSSQGKMTSMTQQILREQKKHADILNEIKKESEELKKEEMAMSSIKESEELLKEKLESLKSMTSVIEKKVKDEDLAIQNSQSHIERLKNMAASMEKNLEKGKSIITPLIKKSQEHEDEIKQLQEDILKKIAEKEKKFQVAGKSSKKIKKFLDRKVEIGSLIDKLNQDKTSLEKELIELIKKAKSFNLASKSGDIGKQMLELEKKFGEVDKKKSVLEKQFRKLSSIFK